MHEQLIQIQAVTISALHVGSKDTSAVTDDLLRRDAQGKILIPGSAIAGPLRTLATRLAPRLYGESCQALKAKAPRDEEPEQSSTCICPVCLLFGTFNPQEGNDKGGQASQLWIYDAYLTSSTTIRDGVGIERATGVAARASAVKFDLELLPAGVAFALRLLLKTQANAKVQARNEQLLAVLLEEWRAGRGTLGGRVARGMGALEIAKIEWHGRNLNEKATLMRYLRREDDNFLAASETQADRQQVLMKQACALAIHAAAAIPKAEEMYKVDREKVDWTPYAIARCWLQAEVTLSFSGPLLINDMTQARRSGYDHAPLAALPVSATVNSAQRWVLPGAGVRGVLRSQAERIARTLATWNAWNASPQDREPRRQHFLNCNPAGDPNVHKADLPLANSDALLTAAGIKGDEFILPFQVDLADQLFGSVRMGSRLIVEDGSLVNQPTLKPLDFLAIDRFTGGGRDSAKFDAVALWQPAFRVRIRLENPQDWELGWLLLALRDIHEALATFGFGAAKGFGVATITQWQAALGFLSDEDFPAQTTEALSLIDKIEKPTNSIWKVATVTNQIVTKQTATEQAENALKPWLAIGETWVQACRQKIASFERKSKPQEGVPLQNADTYFGKLEHLYPVEVKVYGNPT